MRAQGRRITGGPGAYWGGLQRDIPFGKRESENCGGGVVRRVADARGHRERAPARRAESLGRFVVAGQKAGLKRISGIESQEPSVNRGRNGVWMVEKLGKVKLWELAFAFKTREAPWTFAVGPLAGAGQSWGTRNHVTANYDFT